MVRYFLLDQIVNCTVQESLDKLKVVNYITENKAADYSIWQNYMKSLPYTMKCD